MTTDPVENREVMVRRWKKTLEHLDLATLLSDRPERCVELEGSTFKTAQTLWRLARGGRSIRLENCVFSGAVDLRRFSRLGELTFIRCTFEEPVNGSHGRFYELVSFYGCRFKKSLTLAEASFEKGLSVSFCLVEMEKPGAGESVPPKAAFTEAPARCRSAWWPGLRVTGLLRLDRSIFAGSLNLANASIDGPVALRSVEVGSERRRGRVHMPQLRAQGDVDFSPHVPQRNFRLAEGSVIHGGLVLTASTIGGRVDLRGITIHTRLHLPMVRIRNRLEACVWRHASDHDNDHTLGTHIYGREGVALRMSDAIIEQGVTLNGACLYSQLDAKNVEVGGDFYLRQAVDDETNTPLGHDCVVTRPQPNLAYGEESVPSGMSESIRLEGARVKGSVELIGVAIDGEINLQNIQVGGDLRLRELLVEPAAGQLTHGTYTVTLDMARIGRELDLCGSVMHGAIQAKGLEVKGNFLAGDRQALRYPMEHPAIADNFPAENERLIPGVYRQDLDISNSRIAGRMALEGGIFLGNFRAAGVLVGHYCTVSGVVFHGRANFDDAKIDGNLEWLASRSDCFQATWVKGGVSLQRVKIQGNLVLNRFKIGRKKENADDATPSVPAAGDYCFDLSLAVVKGALTASNTADSRAFIFGSTCAAGISVGGDVRWMWTEFQGDLDGRNSRIGGDLDLTGSEVCGHMDLTGAKVDGCAFPLPDSESERRRIQLSPSVRGEMIFERGQFRELFLVLRECVRDDTRERQRAPQKPLREMGRVRRMTTHAADFCVRVLTLIFGFVRRASRAVTGFNRRVWNWAGATGTQFFERSCAVVRLQWDSKLRTSSQDEQVARVGEETSCGPLGVNLKYASIGLLLVRGRLPFDTRPHIAMEGLQFEELDVEKLEDAPDDRAIMRSARGYTVSGELRRRFYFWALPSPFMLLVTLACLGQWLLLKGSWKSFWHRLFDHPYLVYPEMLSLVGYLGKRRETWSDVWAALYPDEVLFPPLVVLAAVWSIWVVVRLLSRKRGAAWWWAWYPQKHSLFLRQMSEMDAGLYGRVESWLRVQGRNEAADRVYLERRLHELQSGITAWWFHLCSAVGMTVCRRPRVAFLKQVMFMTWRGRSAFDHGEVGTVELDNAQREIDQLKRSGRYGRFWRLRYSWYECVHELAGRIIRAPRRWLERLLLLAVGDGVRVGPAVIAFCGLFFFSAFWVFSDAESVERPATYLAVRVPDLEGQKMVVADEETNTDAGTHGRGSPLRKINPRWHESMGSAEADEWSYRDGLWIALGAHVPLFEFGGRENWRPSYRQVRVLEEPFEAYTRWLDRMKQGRFMGPWARWLPTLQSPRYDTWAAMMKAFGWVAVPAILGGLAGFMRRRAPEIENEKTERAK